MAGYTTIVAAVVGSIGFGAAGVLCWRLGLLASFTLQSTVASVGPPAIPNDIECFLGLSQVPGAQRQEAPNGGNVLPLHHPYGRRLGAAPTVTSVAYPPPAYSSDPADRQDHPPHYSDRIVGNRGGMSVAVVPPPLPPSYTVSPELDDHFV
ncbi:hypothetical protein FRC00_007096 [Tulasnella sp. 408]|nr:hypothetical protein FRC00_007096 [Tulasnella sp. 408]